MASEELREAINFYPGLNKNFEGQAPGVYSDPVVWNIRATL